MAETRPPAPKAAKLDGDSAGVEDRQKEPGEEEAQILEKVVSIQHEIDQLNEKASEEILHVEQKFNKLRQPHYARRSELIAAIPDFWRNTLVSNPQFSELLTEDDSCALEYLTNLTVEEYEEAKSGYKITLYFRENPYFSNTALHKEIVMDRSGETKVTGTEINWKDGKNLTNSTTLDNGRKRGLEETSFFSWFSEDSAVEEPGEIIRDDIWPNPLQFYLGGPVEPELNETYEDEEEEDEEDEEEEDGLEDEEEEDDQEVINLSGDEEEDDDDDF